MVRSAAQAGIYHYSPGSWGIVAFDVVNPSNEPVEVLIAAYFAGEPNLQYGRRLWVPARSKRTSWYSILPPPGKPPLNGRMELKTLLLEKSGNTETVMKAADGRMLDFGLLMADQRNLLTGYLANSHDQKMSHSVDPSYEAAVAFLVASTQSRRFAVLQDEFLPPTAESLEGMSQLILCGDQPASDVAGLTAIRRWLYTGGRLWIMLDRVKPETVALLLGDTFDYQVVDRVGLTELQILGTGSYSGEQDDLLRSYETPVDLLRVLVTGVDVTHTVNGWPAAFWQQFGKGRVLFTTLGGHGWMRLRTKRDPHPQDPLKSSLYLATNSLESLTERFLEPIHPTPLQPETFQTILTEQIGYQIIGRRPVAFVLGTFCVSLLLVGLWLASHKRLDRLVWIGPLGSIMTTLVLVIIGAMPSRGVPNTLAVAQFVEAVPGSQDQKIQGLLAVYNQGTSSSPIGATRGGIFQSDMSGLDGVTRRMIWTDLDAWHWENLSLPSGVRFAPFQSFVRSTRRIEARGRFGPNGLTGTVLSGSFEDLQDAIVATPAKESFAVRLDADGSFEVGQRDLLAPGQFIAGRLLSDEQRRRQSIYQQLIPGPHRKKYPEKSTLLAWAKPLDLQFSFPDQTKQVGSALLAIPLSIDPTPPDTEVVIPSSFLPYRAVPGPDSMGSFLTFNNHSREWLERKGSAKTWLRFQMPPEVLPVKLEKATLTVHINGPLEKLEIVGVSEEHVVPIVSRDNPVGTIPFPINTMHLLQPDASGGILLGVFVEVTTTPSTQPGEFDGGTNKWKIDYLRLEVSGTTQKP
ncbi:MAG: hypothetical protein IH899_07020 [Planctomycetes bacterium]|nr:hypothetical protein [Planctomycetota bacterium]